MDEKAQQHFAQVLSLAAEDEHYQQLRHRCELLDSAFLTVIEELPEEKRAVMRAYIQAIGASALRLTEIACEQWESPQNLET